MDPVSGGSVDTSDGGDGGGGGGGDGGVYGGGDGEYGVEDEGRAVVSKLLSSHPDDEEVLYYHLFSFSYHS